MGITNTSLHYIIYDSYKTFLVQLSTNMRQVVTDFTRMNPPALLDPIITTLANYYQKQICMNPLGPDRGSGCVESDHK